MGSAHISLGAKKKEEAGRGVTGLPRRGLFQAIILPIPWLLYLAPKSGLIGSPAQLRGSSEADFCKSGQNRRCYNGSAGEDGLHLRLQIL